MNPSEISDGDALAVTAALITTILRAGNVDDFQILRRSIIINHVEFTPLVHKYWDEMRALVDAAKADLKPKPQ